MSRNSATTLFLVIALPFAIVAAAVPTNGQTIYEYQAGAAPDDGSDSTWEASVNNSIIHTNPSDVRDWALTGETFLPDAGSSYMGITSAYRFSGSGSGGTTGTFTQPTLPIGGGQANAAGASSTWEIWLRPNSANGRTLSDIGDEILWETGGGTNGHVLAFQDAATGVDLVYNARSDAGTAATNPMTITQNLSDPTLLNDFMQIVVTMDPNNATEDDTKVYVNGTEVASFDDWVSWQRGNNASGLGQIANAIPNLSGGSFNGDIALFRIYDDALSAEEVLDNFLTISAVPEPASIAIWTLIGLGLAGFGYVRVRRKK